MPQHLTLTSGERRLKLARAMIGARRAQSLHFVWNAVAQPGWDLLIEIYCAHHAGERISTDQLAASSGFTHPTLQGWLKVLAGERLVRCGADGTGRNDVPQLTALAIATLDSLLDAGIAECADG